MEKIKTVFFGTPEIGIPTLKSLYENPKVDLVTVVTFPDRKVGRKQIFTPNPVKQWALNNNLSITEIDSKTELENWFQNTPFDLGMVIAFGLIFPTSVLNRPRTLIVNHHYSLLPKYRGASPVQSAIKNGDTHTGITLQRMVPQLDAGDIILQQEYPIENQTTPKMFDFLAQESVRLNQELINKWNQLSFTPQNETEATFCGKINKEDGFIYPNNQHLFYVQRHWQALTPWPGQWVQTNKGRIKIIEISQTETGLYLETKTTPLHLKKVQPEGKKPMNITAFKNGYSDVIKASTLTVLPEPFEQK